MSKAQRDPNAQPGRVLCRRISKPIAPEDHRSCPYCYGELAEIGTGQHERFCDFDPDKDPHCYGFPTDSDRNLLG